MHRVDISLLSRDYTLKTVIRPWEKERWYAYLEMETSTLQYKVDMEGLNTLMDEALRMRDFEWAKRLLDKQSTLWIGQAVLGEELIVMQ